MVPLAKSVYSYKSPSAFLSLLANISRMTPPLCSLTRSGTALTAAHCHLLFISVSSRHDFLTSCSSSHLSVLPEGSLLFQVHVLQSQSFKSCCFPVVAHAFHSLLTCPCLSCFKTLQFSLFRMLALQKRREERKKKTTAKKTALKKHLKLA